MKESVIKHVFIFIVFVFSIIFTVPNVNAQSDEEQKVPSENIIGEVVGDAKIIRLQKIIEAKPNDKVLLKDTIRTDKASKTRLLLTDKGGVILEEKTGMSLESYSKGDEKTTGKTAFNLPNGIAGFIRGYNNIEVDTPLAIVTTEKGIVKIKNSDGSVKEDFAITEGAMRCVVKEDTPKPPSEEKPIPSHLIPMAEGVDFIVFETTTDGKAAFCAAVFERCEYCERLNPQGECIPDNFKPCDDGDPCTIDDRCLGGVCKGKKDPSPTDPKCK